jgi:CheY-like chemotaxis protein
MEATTNKVILYAEDDQDDFDTLKDALTQLTDKVRLDGAKNGIEALEYLEKAETYPCLVVLDLNMPLMDGKEVLQKLKADERFREIPVMIFTTSSRKEDIKLCQEHNCVFYRKPTLYRDLLHIVQTMLHICGGA